MTEQSMTGRAIWFVLLMCALLATPVVAAQQPSAQQPQAQQPQAQPPTSTGAAQEGFVPVDQLPKPQDTIPAPRLVAAAYGFVWVAVLVYVWSVRKRLTTVERELQAISQRVDPGGRSS
jgi:CcmD family protein